MYFNPKQFSLAAKRLSSEEDGTITVLSLFMLFTMCVVWAIGLDVAKLMSAQSQLQNTADAAAHAAMVSRHQAGTSENAAKTAAVAIANANMPTGIYGATLTTADIEFGTYNSTTRSFTALAGSTEAVRVTTNRLSSRNNGVSSLLFQFVGITEFDMQTPAVFTSYTPGCLREGYFANEVIDMQSNNDFYDGFSICANGHVELNNNNSFELGTSVKMPNLADLVMPGNGSSNPGIIAALGTGSFRPKIIDQLPAIITGLAGGDPAYLPSYINNFVPIPLGSKNVSSADLTPGSIHTYWCGGGQTLSFSGLISDVVVVTDCKVGFSNNTQLQDVIIATENTDAKSISGSVGVEIGTDDSCAIGGGAQLLTLGSFFSPAKINLYGGQIIAADDIKFAANATGVHGASFIAGGSIDATSNAQMSYCGTGMEDNFEASYFRMSM